MPLILPGNVGSATAATGYDVANSARFNSGSSDTLTRTPGSASNRRTFTISFWVKRSSVDSAHKNVFSSGAYSSTQMTQVFFEASDELIFSDFTSSPSQNFNLTTNRKFRDPSAWYHIFIAVDTTQGTASNRIKIYVNGVQETSFATESYPSQNFDCAINVNQIHTIGNRNGASLFFDGYLSEFVFVDGTAQAHTDVGEFDSDSGIWKPIDVSGLTFGTNGFYLNFETSAELGDDVSGNTNDFTETNLTAVDQSIDTCTNNFATMNPLENYYQAATLTEGNLKLLTATTSNVAPSLATVALTAGKWYYEAKYVSDSLAVSAGAIGIVGNQITSATAHAMLETAQKYGLYLSDGDIWHNNSKVQELGAHVDHTATIGIALDFDNNRITFSKDGSWGDGSGNWDESSPHTYYTIAAPSTVDFQAYFPAFGDWSSGSIGYEINFGSPIYSISSGNQDANGYGNFEYAVPSGYFAICSKNLAEYGG